MRRFARSRHRFAFARSEHRFARSRHRFARSRHRFSRSMRRFARSRHRFARSKHQFARSEHRFARSRHLFARSRRRFARSRHRFARSKHRSARSRHRFARSIGAACVTCLHGMAGPEIHTRGIAIYKPRAGTNNYMFGSPVFQSGRAFDIIWYYNSVSLGDSYGHDFYYLFCPWNCPRKCLHKGLAFKHFWKNETGG